MSVVTIYHNPRCSKSRHALSLIESSGYEAEIILYLENPPSASALDAMFSAMGREPLEVMRTKEARFAELGLSTKDVRPRREWLRILEQNPVLLERPIVVNKNKVVLGRPPENVLDIL